MIHESICESIKDPFFIRNKATKAAKEKIDVVKFPYKGNKREIFSLKHRISF